jgi:hypothetical protein
MAWEPDYATTAELKAFCRVTDNVDDAQFALAVTAASRIVDSFCGRRFGKVSMATSWTFPVEYARHQGGWVALIEDLSSATGLTVTVAGSAVTNYTLGPARATDKGRPYASILMASYAETVTMVSDAWGWASVPTPIKQATLLQGSRLMVRRDSPFGVAGSPDTGGEIRLLARVDPDVAVVCRPYRRVVSA